MRHCHQLRLCVLAACLLPAAAPGGQQKTEEIKGWGTVVDPDGDCKFTEAKGKLTITVPRTHHDLTYTAQTTKLNAPRVLQKVRGDFQLDVKVLTIPLPARTLRPAVCTASTAVACWSGRTTRTSSAWKGRLRVVPQRHSSGWNDSRMAKP